MVLLGVEFGAEVGEKEPAAGALERRAPKKEVVFGRRNMKQNLKRRFLRMEPS